MSITATIESRDELHEQVGAWARHHYGPRVRAGRPVTPEGHSGLTVMVPVVLESGQVVDEVVIRLPPKGVKPKRNTDVLRQIPVLRHLATTEVPVAPVLDPGTDTRWFGRPFLIVRRMPGETRSIDDGPGRAPGPEHVREAITVLGMLHKSVPAEALTGWDTVNTYADELRAWDRALERMPNDDWRTACGRLRERLADVLPVEAATGLVHGDYQFSNLLYDVTRITAVLDWEVATLGPQLLDLGWFVTINDQDSWAHRVATAGIPPTEVIVDWYESAADRAVDKGELAAACALAAYRFAVIAGLNLSLHRTGRRVDPHWEKIAPSIPRLVECGLRRLRR